MGTKLPMEIDLGFAGLAFNLQGVKGVALLQDDLFWTWWGGWVLGLFSHIAASE